MNSRLTLSILLLAAAATPAIADRAACPPDPAPLLAPASIPIAPEIPVPFIEYWCWRGDTLLAHGLAQSYGIHANGATTVILYGGEQRRVFSPSIACYFDEALPDVADRAD